MVLTDTGKNRHGKTSGEVNGSMLFTSHDIDVIERALRSAIKHEEDRSGAEDFREVLQKLQDSATKALLQDEPGGPIAGGWLGGLGDD